jgi:hypothetical protein
MGMNILAIEVGIEPEYENALIASAKKAGWSVEVVRHVPFTNEFVDKDHLPLPRKLLENPNVWLHGSIQAVKAAQHMVDDGTLFGSRPIKWQVHAPWADLRCAQYYPQLKGRLLQKDWRLTTIEGLRDWKDQLFEELGEDDSLFVRPSENDKLFSGGCITREDFQESYDLITFYDPPLQSHVIVARPRKINAEARFLIVDGKLVTGSFYKTGGQSLRLEASDNLMEIAQDFLDFCLSRYFNPSPSWVLDLAQTAEGWHIIEVGATSCCGLYKCDTDKFIQALAELP